MKYGILTFHNIPNIGALLQAYSLCKALRNIGIECDIIDYQCENIKRRELIYKPHPNLLKDIVLRFYWPKTQKKIEFCQAYMRSKQVYSKMSYDASNIKLSNKAYDAFISGSDMIWNLNVTGFDYNYFLSFVDETKPKYSYGSSIGDKWQEKDISRIKELLSRYDRLSVREKDTCEAIQALGLKCEHVVDPTMLIPVEEWEKEALKPQHEKYVLVYFASKEIIHAAKKYAKAHRLRVVLMSSGVPKPFILNVFPNTPPEWLGWLKNADAVFTNSFHGLLFSLYFKKPVWTANYCNRITSLTESMKIKKCLLKDDLDLENEIDYTDVAERIEHLRQSSLAYLRNIKC